MAPRIRATLTKPQIIVLIRFLHSWDHRHGKVLDDIRPRWATEGNVDVVVFTHRTKRWSTSPSDAIPAASSSRARSRRRHSSIFQASSTTSDEALSQSGVNVVDHARTAQSLLSFSKTPLRDRSPSSQGRQGSQSPPDRLSPPKVSSRG